MGAPVTLTVPDGASNFDRPLGTAASPLQTATPVASSSATSRVATSTAAATLRTANASRKGVTVYNESAAILYVLLGTGATATNYTMALPASGYYEVPFSWTGVVSGTLATGTGNAQVTELT